MADNDYLSLTCPECGTPIPDGQLLCPKCNPLPAQDESAAETPNSTDVVAQDEPTFVDSDATDAGFAPSDTDAAAGESDEPDTFTFEDVNFGPSDSELDKAFAPKGGIFTPYSVPATGAAAAVGVSFGDETTGASEISAISDSSVSDAWDAAFQTDGSFATQGDGYDISTASGDFTETFDPSTLEGGATQGAGSAVSTAAKIVPMPLDAAGVQQAVSSILGPDTAEAATTSGTAAAGTAGSGAAAGSGTAGASASASPIVEAVGNAPAAETMKSTLGAVHATGDAGSAAAGTTAQAASGAGASTAGAGTAGAGAGAGTAGAGASGAGAAGTGAATASAGTTAATGAGTGAASGAATTAATATTAAAPAATTAAAATPAATTAATTHSVASAASVAPAAHSAATAASTTATEAATTTAATTATETATTATTTAATTATETATTAATTATTAATETATTAAATTAAETTTAAASTATETAAATAAETATSAATETATAATSAATETTTGVATEAAGAASAAESAGGAAAAGAAGITAGKVAGAHGAFWFLRWLIPIIIIIGLAGGGGYWWWSSNRVDYSAEFIDAATGSALADPQTGTGNSGDTVDFSAPEVDGYTLESPATQSVTLEKDQEAHVTFTYKKQVTYTVNYVDQDGGEVQGAKSGEGVEGDSVTEKAPQVDGYVLTSNDAMKLTLQADNGANVITFTYAKRVKYTVNFVGTDGAALGTRDGEGVVGEKAEPGEALYFDQYTLISTPEAITLSKDEGANVMTFTYDRIPDPEPVVQKKKTSTPKKTYGADGDF